MDFLKTICGICGGAFLFGLVTGGCGTSHKVKSLREGTVQASMRLPSDFESTLPQLERSTPRRDTLRVRDESGQEVFIMKAVRSENGEMVANDVLDAAVVTARFRNVAERHGKVDLEFQVVIPQSLLDSKWQLRLYPDMFMLGDSIRLDGVIITGSEYRKAQLKGYQQYEKFLSSIISDTTRFIDLRQLEIFLRRNIPALYAMRTDSTEVSDEAFRSVYGTTEQEAVEHYTNRFAVKMNDRKKARRQKMYNKYVKSPIVTEGLRLDTVMRSINGDFIYNYVQTIKTRPHLKKVEIYLSGGIYEADKRLYRVPKYGPLTFYISSISTLVDPKEKYRTKVIERRASANTACFIEFRSAHSDIDPTLGHNAHEVGRIHDNLRSLLSNEKYDLDSIVVKAGCSPEGAVGYNRRLSLRRGEAVSAYFNRWMLSYIDSLERDRGVVMDMDGSVINQPRMKPIPFIAHSEPENWHELDMLITRDTVLTESQKESYRKFRLIEDADARERAMSKEPYYRRMREAMYPRLRAVRFDFHLHRKGMIKDTVHTTELDSTYMRGVQLIRDRDYKSAITLLRPYNDYNTAVAYCLLDYNASAMSILSHLELTPQVEYLLAVLYSREGDDEKAVNHYLSACRKDSSYRHRGNLDPEISALIKTYALNLDEEVL